MSIFSFAGRRDIYRVNVSHTLNSVATSIIGVYVPIFLLVHGFSLSQTIVFFMTLHCAGALFAVTIIPSLIRKWGLISTFKLYYPLEIICMVMLNILPFYPGLFWIVAIIGGLATFSYWVPLNILLVKNTEKDVMGSDVANFFALPKVFGIAGPLIGAALVPFVGFWPVFGITIIGLLISYVPLRGITNQGVSNTFDLKISNVWSKLKERKSLFVLEMFDNIIEESEWFWGILVYLIIGTLQAPGIAGSLSAIGGALFTVFVGKYANKNPRKLIPIAIFSLIIVWGVRVFIDNALHAYIITVFASFISTLFLVSYFSMIYKEIRYKEEEEFLILREIPTVMGRMIVFSTVLVTINYPKLFFALPVLALILLAFLLYSSHESRRA